MSNPYVRPPLEANRLRKVQALRDAGNGDVVDFLESVPYDEKFEFLRSLAHQLRTWGSLSEKQIAAARKLKAKRDEHEREWKREEARRTRNAKEFPREERFGVRLRVVKGKHAGGEWGGIGLVCEVREGEYAGNRVYFVAPNALEDAVATHLSMQHGMFAEPEDYAGKEFAITATWTRGEDDAHFAFGHRPHLEEGPR